MSQGTYHPSLVESRDDGWMGVGWTRVDPTVTMRFRIRGTPLDLGHVIGQQTWYDETRWAWTTESRKSGTRNHANLNPTGRTSLTSHWFAELNRLKITTKQTL
ncbi:hypothetical protein BHE74_00041241 [Ensete ventricosum]|nr:hypothetical protein BHE74_00041241 [Ensete ventricosum]RZR98483.1 hypothetical protein BHM03_00027839 [Ensete ventricosum]